MSISPEQANVLRQWFYSLQDVHPEYLEEKDYELAAKLYELCGIQLPNSIRKHLHAKHSIEQTALPHEHLQAEFDYICAGCGDLVKRRLQTK